MAKRILVPLDNAALIAGLATTFAGSGQRRGIAQEGGD
jgi:hypothetical protein